MIQKVIDNQIRLSGSGVSAINPSRWNWGRNWYTLRCDQIQLNCLLWMKQSRALSDKALEGTVDASTTWSERLLVLSSTPSGFLYLSRAFIKCVVVWCFVGWRSGSKVCFLGGMWGGLVFIGAGYACMMLASNVSNGIMVRNFWHDKQTDVTKGYINNWIAHTQLSNKRKQHRRRTLFFFCASVERKCTSRGVRMCVKLLLLTIVAYQSSFMGAGCPAMEVTKVPNASESINLYIY